MVVRRVTRRSGRLRRSQFTQAGILSLLLLVTTVLPALAGFGSQATFPTGAQPTGLAVADFNDDGKLDLAVLNATDQTVGAILNTTPTGATTPTFSAQTAFATVGSPVSVVAVDLNGDGKPDLAIVHGNQNFFRVFLNTTPTGAGTPSFSGPTPFSTDGVGPSSIAAGDFNDDGVLDLVIGHGTSSNASVLLNTTPTGAGTPSFAVGQPFSAGVSQSFVAVADLNGDAKLDLAVTNGSGNTVSVLFNTTPTGAGTLSFTTRQTFATSGNPGFVLPTDVNGDAKLDLVVANRSGNSLSVLLNSTAIGSGTPSFDAQQTFATGTGLLTVAAGDLNGDGKPDLVNNSSASNTVSVRLNTTTPGSSTASFSAPQPQSAGGLARHVVVADLNGDSKPDIAVTNQSANTIGVFLANASGALQFSGPIFNVAEAGGSVNVSLTRTGSTDGQVSGIVSLTGGDATQGQDFTFAAPQTVTWADGDGADKTVNIPITQDQLDEANETIQLTLTLPTNPFGATLGAQTSMTGTITDDDTAGITVTESGGSTAITEGGATDSFTVVLLTQPTADVIVTLNPGSQLTTTPAPALTFTTLNWNIAQTVTVTAVDDPNIEGNHNGSVAFAVTSTDPLYNNFVVPSVTATITDNDSAGVSIVQSGGSTAVTEGGATDFFTAVLTTQPTANVTVALNAGSQLTTSPTPALTFTPANWNVPQTVTVTAVDDTVDKGVHSGSVSFSVASADGNYSGLSVAGISVTITDNDTPILTISPTTATRAEGDVGTGPLTFTVSMTPQSVLTVTVQYAAVDGTAQAGADFTVASGTLTFAPGETSKSVTVQVVGDTNFEPDETFRVVLSNPNNGIIGTAQATATITNDDAPASTPPDDSGRGTGKNKDTNSAKPPSQLQQQQTQHTNDSNLDQYHTEGHVASVERSADGATLLVTIALGRGETLVVEVRCEADRCTDIRPGDYLNADGEQGGRNEQGRFIAEQIEVTRNGGRVR